MLPLLYFLVIVILLSSQCFLIFSILERGFFSLASYKLSTLGIDKIKSFLKQEANT
ncbi:hypothetical protein KIS1582_2709 [Cytobacillus firmus]|uniref:Uncharacterized protein n=1 Tax=Cytobacillus firmus TaxID=1399 RepID=A0A800MVW7_CYTFI|nr:hypothetical protein KIS1582_2709 [Cytobacillus firmus]